MANAYAVNSGAKKVVTYFLRPEAFLFLVMVVLGVVVAIMNPNFHNIKNLMNILLQVSVTGIICVGVGIVLIAGEIDISVGSQVSVIGIIFSSMIVTANNVPLAIVLAVGAGLTMGLINGLIVWSTKAASFIITLGTQVIFRGIALVISQGYFFTLLGKFQLLGRGKLFSLVPIQVLLFVLVVLLGWLVLRFTRFGRLLYAVGGNPQAAYVSGVRTGLYKVTIFVICGGLVSFATIILISQLGAAYPNTGDPYALNALAAIIVGGVALTGGKGTALGIFLGAVIFGLISNVLNILNVNAFWRDVALGLIIIFAVAISGISERKR
jgi:ribose transport system permease protein